MKTEQQKAVRNKMTNERERTKKKEWNEFKIELNNLRNNFHSRIQKEKSDKRKLCFAER